MFVWRTGDGEQKYRQKPGELSYGVRRNRGGGGSETRTSGEQAWEGLARPTPAQEKRLTVL